VTIQLCFGDTNETDGTALFFVLIIMIAREKRW